MITSEESLILLGSVTSKLRDEIKNQQSQCYQNRVELFLIFQLINIRI